MLMKTAAPLGNRSRSSGGFQHRADLKELLMEGAAVLCRASSGIDRSRSITDLRARVCSSGNGRGRGVAWRYPANEAVPSRVISVRVNGVRQ